MVTDVGHAQRVITRTRDAETSGGIFTEIGLVTWRSLVKLTRTPVLLFFSLFMPLIWLVMFSQTFGTVFSAAATQLPYDYVAVLPKGVLPSWVQTFSTVNPVSYMADAARGLILTGFDWTAIGNAFLAIIAFGIVLNGLAVMAFRAQGK